jgi:hypothetical protein
VVLLWGRHLTSWLLAIDEHSGHECLCGSNRQSVIPYIYERTKLYYSSMYEPESFLFLTPWKGRLPESFIAQGRVVYNEPQGLTCGLMVGKTICYRTQWLGVANDVFNRAGMPGLVACHPALGQQYDAVSLRH